MVTIAKRAKRRSVGVCFMYFFLCVNSAIGYAKKPTKRWPILSKWFLSKWKKSVIASNGTFSKV